MTPEPRDRNPFVAITALVLVLATAAGAAARYGLNGAVTGVCVAIAILGTWVLLSPKVEVLESTLPAAGPYRAVSVAEAPGPTRQRLRGTPLEAVGFDRVKGREPAVTPPARLPDFDLDTSDDIAPVRALGQLPRDAAALQVDADVDPAGTISGAFTLGPFEVRSSSRRGSDNMVLNDPRQDDYVVASAAHGKYLVVVVADGVASAEHAPHGAHWSCRLLVRTIDEHLREGVPGIEKMLERTREEVTRRFESTFVDGTKTRTIGVELVGLIAPIDGGPAAGFRVGDGEILVREDDGWRSVFSGVAADTSADTDLAFPQSVAADVAPLELDGRCLLLGSDGVTDPITSNSTVASNLRSALVRPVSEVEFDQLLTFPLEEARGDRTAVAVWFTAER